MYLRKSAQRSGGVRRYYISIAHNLWVVRPESPSRHAGARPVRLVHLGESSRVDLNRAQILVSVLRELLPAPQRDMAPLWVESVSLRLRRLTGFLREAVAPKSETEFNQEAFAATLREALRPLVDPSSILLPRLVLIEEISAERVRPTLVSTLHLPAFRHVNAMSSCKDDS